MEQKLAASFFRFVLAANSTVSGNVSAFLDWP